MFVTGCESTAFVLQVGWAAEGAESGAPFQDIDLVQGVRNSVL